MLITDTVQKRTQDTYNFYTRCMLENHMDLIRQKSFTVENSLALTPQETSKYRGDFYSLLKSRGVADRLHWITMRINGFNSSTDFQGMDEHIMLPDEEFLESLLNKHTNVGVI